MPDGTIHAEGMASTAMSSAPPPRGVLVLAGHLRAAVRVAAAVTERRNTIPILAHLLLRARLLALPPVDWPWMVEAKFRTSFGIPVASLRRLLTLPWHAVSTEETRYYLNGIYLERNHDAGGPWLTAVATDGHRLVKVDEPLPDGAGAMPNVIVPRKTVARLRALLDSRAGGEVRVEVADQRIRVQVGTVTLESKLIDGTFPDYRRVIPRADAALATMKVHQPRAFRDAIETAAAISTERSRPVRFTGAEGGIVITSREPEGGETQVDLPADVATWAGPIREIGFQCRYLAALARILPEGFTAGIQDGSAPMRIDFPRGIAVLMPMRI